MLTNARSEVQYPGFYLCIVRRAWNLPSNTNFSKKTKIQDSKKIPTNVDDRSKRLKDYDLRLGTLKVSPFIGMLRRDEISMW